MKKIIKISLLILFIIFVFGITTSNAADYRVTIETTNEQMIQELNNSNRLTGISGYVKDENDHLYCIHKDVNIREEAFYYKVGEPKTYPGDDPNGHAKAYILAAPGYEKSDGGTGPATKNDERQWAWYVAIGQESEPNDLYNIAMEYQNYKNNEQNVELINPSTSKTLASGNDLVYGPIKIKYSYKNATSGSKSDQWGGFKYAFFDEDGNNVSDKVKLCTLSNGTYNQITSTLISSNEADSGYYKVSKPDYNEKDVYIVINDKKITKVNIKVKANTVEYEASIQELYGEYKEEYAGRWYCNDCKGKYHEYQGNLYELTSSITYTDFVQRT